MFPHRNFSKFTWTPPDGKTHNQIDNILINKELHSNIVDFRTFRGADPGTDYYLVVTIFREKL